VQNSKRTKDLGDGVWYFIEYKCLD
jgi:hypothetical protein